MGMKLLHNTTIIRRALTLAPDGTAYLATWVDVERDTKDGPERATLPVLLARDAKDGTVSLIKVGAADAFARPDQERECPEGVAGDIPRTSPPTSSEGMVLSADTVARLLDGERPRIGGVFAMVKAAFARMVAFPTTDDVTHDDYAGFFAAYVLSTYLLPAFTAVGYVWLYGLPSSGKSTAAHVIARTACLPLMASASSTLASLRGHADAGGTLVLDNWDTITNKDDNTRTLRSFCEIGYQQGAVVTLQVPSATGRGWETARCNVYCNRAFTGIADPPDALASRCIAILMIRTDDQEKAALSPGDDANWSHTPEAIVQGCWMVAAHYLRDAVATVKGITSKNTGLTNRDLQVWRPVLTVARLVDGDRGDNATRDAILRLASALLNARADDDGSREAYVTKALAALHGEKHGIVTASVVMERANQLADAQDADVWGLDSAKKVGRLLTRMGVAHAPRTGQGRGYILTPEVIARLQATHLPAVRPPGNVTNVTNDTNDAPGAPGGIDVCDVSDIGDVTKVRVADTTLLAFSEASQKEAPPSAHPLAADTTPRQRADHAAITAYCRNVIAYGTGGPIAGDYASRAAGLGLPMIPMERALDFARRWLGLDASACEAADG